MNTDEFKEQIKKDPYIEANSNMHRLMHEMSERARKLTFEMNVAYRSPEELRKLFTQLIGKEVDESFGIFPQKR